MADVVTIAQGDDSRLVETRRFLIRDPQAFAAIWAAHAGQDAVAPTVDFSKRMVAAVFAGERPTPGFTVAVTGTRREGSALVVVIDERHPDPSLVSAQVTVSPFHIVTLPRDDGEIGFNMPDAGGLQEIVFKAPAAAKAPPQPGSRVTPPARKVSPAIAPSEGASSYTGLTPQVAASLAYLAGPFSGLLLLATEPASSFVRFHAWQAVVGLGSLGVAAGVFLTLAFVLLIVSPMAFWAMLWLAAATGSAWVVVWALCVFNAYKGRVWKLPLAGDYAERHA